MLSFLLVVAIVVWFALLYPVARQSLRTETVPQNVPVAVPVALVATFAMMPLVFIVPREDGNAVLEQGLTASNVVMIVMTGLTGLYLALRVSLDRRVLLVPFSMPYLPFTLMILVNGISTLWSIVPMYTAYRTVELAIFYLATILIFDRSDIERRLPDLLAVFIVVWLVAVTPVILANLASGIVFSSAKNNMMPYVCAVLAFAVVFGARTRWRVPYFVLAVVGFVIAGSASSTGALIALVPGVLIASPYRNVRILGFVTMVLVGAVFVVLMLGLSAFPALLDLVSVILQKPAEELANATGRGTLWPTFLAATGDRLVGSGYSAADRFIQLLMPPTALTDASGRDTVFLTSAHNMFLSAWAGTGLIGLCFCATVLGSAVRWGLKLDLAGRRLVVSSVIFVALNGMTTPGIFQDWNVNVLAFVALLAFTRIGLLNQSAAWGAPAPRPAARPMTGRPALDPAWRAS